MATNQVPESWRYNMKFNFNFNLNQFVKTKVAQQIQQSQIGNFVKQKGAPAIISTILKSILGQKPKAHEGVDMGQQVEPGVIPVIYGHVGMSNTQFDLGQKPSEVDAEFVTQEIRMPISEGSIIGVAKRLNDNQVSFFTGDSTEHLKQVVINDSFVIDPNTNVANFKDIKFEKIILLFFV